MKPVAGPPSFGSRGLDVSPPPATVKTREGFDDGRGARRVVILLGWVVVGGTAAALAAAASTRRRPKTRPPKIAPSGTVVWRRRRWKRCGFPSGGRIALSERVLWSAYADPGPLQGWCRRASASEKPPAGHWQRHLGAGGKRAMIARIRGDIAGIRRYPRLPRSTGRAAYPAVRAGFEPGRIDIGRRLTRERSLVRTQPRPLKTLLIATSGGRARLTVAVYRPVVSFVVGTAPGVTVRRRVTAREHVQELIGK